MEQLNKLLDKIKETRSLASDNALAAALGVKRQTVSNWRQDRTLPDAVQCATIAGLTGEPLARVLGIVGEARAISREEKAVWHKLATSVAAVILLAVAIPLPATPAHAAQRAGMALISQNTAGNAYYVISNARRLLMGASVFRWLAYKHRYLSAGVGFDEYGSGAVPAGLARGGSSRPVRGMRRA